MGTLFQTLKDTFSDFSEDECAQMAAALAYYATFSLAPLLVLIVLITGIFVQPEEVETQLRSQIQSVVGPEATEQIKVMLEQANRPSMRSWGSIISVVALLFGVSGMFMQIQQGLNKTWEVAPDPEQGGIKNFIMKRLASLSMLLVLAFLMLVSLVFSAFLAAADNLIAGLLPGALAAGAWQAISMGVSFLLVMVLFAAIYKVLPDAKISWHETWLGSFVAAALFTLGKFLFTYYVGTQNLGATFGAAASLAAVLLWVYFMGMVLFLGAEFTQAWAQSHGRRIEPDSKAVRVVQHKEQIREAPV